MDKSKRIIIETVLKDSATKGLKDLGSGMEDTSKKGFSLEKAAVAAKVAIAALAAAAVGVTVAAYRVGVSFDEARSDIIKMTGASGDALEDMMGSLKGVSKTVPQDLATVSSAIGGVSTRLDLTGKDLADTSKAFLDFSRVTGTEVEPAIKGVTRFMNDWGVESKDTNKVLDQMTAVAHATGITIEQLTTTGVNYGVQLRALGFTQEESIALMGKWEKEGVATEKMVGGLSIALGRLAQAGIDDTAVAFEEIIKGMKDIDSVGEVTREAIELLGVRAGPDFALAVKEGRFEFEDYIALIEGSEGTLADAAKSSLTLGDRWDMLKNRVNALLEPIGTFLVESLGKAMTKFSEWGETVQETKAFQLLKDWFEETSESVKEFIVDSLEVLTEKWNDFKTTLNDWWESDSRKKIQTFFEELGKAIAPFTDYILPTLILFWEVLADLWETFVTPAIEDLKEELKELVKFLGLDDIQELIDIVLILLAIALLPTIMILGITVGGFMALIGVIALVIRVVTLLIKAVQVVMGWFNAIRDLSLRITGTFYAWATQIWGVRDALLAVKNAGSGISDIVSGALGRRQSGGNVMRSGMYKVGEFGPEQVYLPQGSRVVNASDTSKEEGQQQVIINNTFSQVDMDVEQLARKLSFQLTYI